MLFTQCIRNDPYKVGGLDSHSNKLFTQSRACLGLGKILHQKNCVLQIVQFSRRNFFRNFIDAEEENFDLTGNQFVLLKLRFVCRIHRGLFLSLNLQFLLKHSVYVVSSAATTDTSKYFAKTASFHVNLVKIFKMSIFLVVLNKHIFVHLTPFHDNFEHLHNYALKNL